MGNSMRDAFNSVETWVFYPAAVIILVFVILGAVFTQATGEVFTRVQSGIVEYFGWFYILSASFFLIFAIWLIFSPYRRIKLGPDDSEPEFSYTAWFAMLFSAGMGIGLVFWGVAEPAFHFMTPPPFQPGIEAESPAAAQESMRFTFFHWGLHPWAIYVVFGLGLAYFHFRQGLPLAPRSILYPILGDRIHGPIGYLVDVIAIVGTLLGVATSLGLGAIQVNGGLNTIAGVGVSDLTQVLIIAGITAIALTSVVLGLHSGIRRLSNLNIYLAAALVLFMLALGPTIFLLNLFVETTGSYLQLLPVTSFWAGGLQGEEWQSSWTLFYWGWWISWAPFVGLFIARISKGRTIREFVTGVLLVPTLVSFLWFSVFGGNALFAELYGAGGITDAASESPPLALYALLDLFPFTAIVAGLATLLVITFFVTSSDSGSLVVDMISSGGNPNPPTPTRVFWAVLEGAVAAVLLLTGGLSGLQTAAITGGLPVAVVMFFITYSLVQALREDRKRMIREERERLGLQPKHEPAGS